MVLGSYCERDISRQEAKAQTNHSVSDVASNLCLIRVIRAESVKSVVNQVLVTLK
jgi:hypothetical protein